MKVRFRNPRYIYRSCSECPLPADAVEKVFIAARQVL